MSAVQDFTSSQVTIDTQATSAAGDQTVPPTSTAPVPSYDASAGTNFPGGHPNPDDQNRFAAGDQATQSTIDAPAPICLTSTGSQPPGSHSRPDAHISVAAGDQPTEGQPLCGAQASLALGSASPDSLPRSDTQKAAAVRGPILADPVLGVLAEVVDDLESVRVANENRLRTLTDMGERGHGLTVQHPEIARLASLVAELAASEHQAILNLSRVMRAHPLGVWAKPMKGVGDKQLARLLATIGDPYWNDLHNRPRTVSELWAFCGYHVIRTSGGQFSNVAQGKVAAGSNFHPGGQGVPGPHSICAAGVAPKRQRGQKSNWSEDARKRCFLIATSAIKKPPAADIADWPYRLVYDETRTKYADAVHTSDCVRCGPKGKPALAGSPLSLGHQHARGLRAVSKQLLKDLWRESKRIHEYTGVEQESAA